MTPGSTTVTAARSRRILIVDDAPDMRRLYTALLRADAYDYEVAEAGNVTQAFAMLSAHRYDCVLLDYHLPGQNGLKLLRTLHEQGGSTQCAVVMITGQGNESVAVQAMKLGARDYLIKSRINREVLVAAIEFAIEQSRSEVALARQRESLERAAATDPLTGLYNRRYLLEAVETELARAQRYGSPLSVLMMDIDLFKKINDRYGHLTGDRVLANFAAMLRRLVRATDIVARFGGEEFCAILCETPLDGARQLAERITLATRVLRHDDGRDGDFAVSVSTGIAVARPNMLDPEELIGQGDDALYCAKRCGRDRYCVFGVCGSQASPPAREATDTAFRV